MRRHRAKLQEGSVTRFRALAAAGHFDAEHRPGRSLLVTVTAAPLAGVPCGTSCRVLRHESTESAALGAPRSKKELQKEVAPTAPLENRAVVANGKVNGNGPCSRRVVGEYRERGGR